MMKTKQMKTGIRIFTITILLLTFGITRAQEVVHSIGVRLGGNGIAYKYVEDQYRGFEAILGFRERGIQFTGLVEAYKPVKTDRINNLYFFWGGGGHAGYKGVKKEYYRDNGNGFELYTERKYNPVFGLDGIFGGEYHFYSIPLAVSLDYKPYMEFFGEEIFRVDLWDFGFTFRYTF